MKKRLISLLAAGIVFFNACLFSNDNQQSIKDFDQHMLDLRIYHENLGDALLARDKDYATWFVNDIDSILRLMANEFTSHRKLNMPFKHDYKKRLAPCMKDLKAAIEKNEWQTSIKKYSILTRECNDCHIDHDIDKEVRDVTLGAKQD
jgi:hypothetical protein